MAGNLTTPVHIDFTTLYGAASCLEGSAETPQSMFLSQLLSLSQLVEAVVLHDRLEYELGSTPDWAPYRAGLEKTDLYRNIATFGLPLCPSEAQVDASESEIVEAARWITQHAHRIDLRSLEWATRFRSGTYNAFRHARDEDNPLIRRYLGIVDAAGDGVLVSGLSELIRHFRRSNIGLLGLHVLFRLRLIEQTLVEPHLSNYSPHFSRQPLVAALNDPALQVKEWTMKQLVDKRREILGEIEPLAATDPISANVSPILLACLKARTPLDILDQAMDIRESRAAQNYRAECRELLERAFWEGESAIVKYKIRVVDRLRDLRSLLFEKGARHEVMRQISFDSRSLIPFGYNVAMRWTTRKEHVPGDSAVVFLRDIFSDSLGFVSTADRIREIFHNADVHCDTPMIGCVLPGRIEVKALEVARDEPGS